MAILGFKRGVFYTTVSFIGFFLIIILSYILKNPLSILMYENLPFFNFGGIIAGVTVLNIAVYEVIAFLIVSIILTIIYKLILTATRLFEKLLKITVILGIPSKLLGAVVGAVKGLIICFIALYVISLPFIDSDVDFITESKYKDEILTKTPFLSSIGDESVKVFNEFASIRDSYRNQTNPQQFNYETLDLFLKHKLITIESVKKLDERGKLKIDKDKIETLIDKYEGE
jgi:uncharacterized membrane protein required for colicin V production